MNQAEYIRGTQSLPPREWEAKMRRRERRCLRCQQMFRSDGPGNRICSPCGDVNRKVRVSDAELNASRGRSMCGGEVISGNG